MTTPDGPTTWRRRPAEPRELATAIGAAAAVGAAVGAATFWLVRTLSARETVALSPAAPERRRLT